MPRRQAKKRRQSGPADGRPETANGASTLFNHDIDVPATDAEKSLWQGWCEIESEPAFFNVMLREFGVKGAKIQEIFSLEEELLQFLPKPVYGIIFLYRFNEGSNEDEETGCPDHVWFANQTTGNACATVALLNIVNNVPDVELGEHLSSFRSFSEALAPALRGEQLANFEFIKHIHNSFARKMDMMNIDLGMQQDAQRKRAAKGQELDEEAAFHFVAYLPIGGDVWKLDGLERQPKCLGKYGDQEWLSYATPFISERMIALGEEGQSFGLLGVVRDPLDDHRQKLAANIKTLQLVDSAFRDRGHERQEEASSGHHSEVLSFLEGSSLPDLFDEGLLTTPSAIYGITHLMIEEATPLDRSLEACTTSSCLASDIELLKGLIEAQKDLRSAIMDEIQSERVDQERANSRRQDFGPLIRLWLKMLADNDVLQALYLKHGD